MARPKHHHAALDLQVVARPHSLLSPLFVHVFDQLRVAVTMLDVHDWHPIHEVDGMPSFELERGVEAKRVAYNERCLKEVMKKRAPVLGRYAGFWDLFVPVVGERWNPADAGDRSFRARAADEQRSLGSMALAQRSTRASVGSSVCSLRRDVARDRGSRRQEAASVPPADGVLCQCARGEGRRRGACTPSSRAAGRAARVAIRRAHVGHRARDGRSAGSKGSGRAPTGLPTSLRSECLAIRRG